MEKRKIKYLMIKDTGYVGAELEGHPIETFKKNGETAEVEWFRCGNREFNGKYVIEVGYGEDK